MSNSEQNLLYKIFMSSYLSIAMPKSVEVKAPLTIDFEVTDVCNWGCIFCSNAWKGCQKRAPPISFNRIKNIINKMHKAEVLGILISGGEPTQSPHFKKILKYCYDCGFLIQMTSNGTFSKKDISDVSSYVNSLGVSIHGLNEAHDNAVKRKGAFEKVLNGIKNAKECGIPTGCLFTAVKSTYRNFRNVAAFLKNNFEIKDLSITRFVPVGAGEKRRNELELPLVEMKRLLCLMEKTKNELKMNITLSDAFPRCLVPERQKSMIIGCNAGIFSASIDPWGNFKFCSPSPTIIGNLFEKPLEELWNTALMKKLRTFDWAPEMCQKCPDFDVCLVGCKISYKQPFGPDCYLMRIFNENK